MNTTLRLRPLALAVALAGSIAALSTNAQAQSATTDPVGYYTVTIVAGADNVISLPMVRDAVFAGTVQAVSDSHTFTALAGSSSPGWTASQYKHDSTIPSQRLTYYCEFTSGALKGLYYPVTDNGSNNLILDTESDNLQTGVPLPGGNALLAAGDSFKIRPYWRITDIFESGGVPIIKARTGPLDNTEDEILFPNYTTVGQNKSASLDVYYQGGWKAFGQSADYADQIIRPNEAVVVRRKGNTNLSLTNLGNVLMNRGIYFFPGGDNTVGNDTYFSVARPAAVSLNNSGLHLADQTKSPVLDTPSALFAGLHDCVLAFDVPVANAGYNLAAPHTYYYLAGSGWREKANPSTTVGDDVMLQPGQAYILRKRSTNTQGSDWSNDPNY